MIDWARRVRYERGSLCLGVGASPSGKAPVFGTGIPGSNPGAPANTSSSWLAVNDRNKQI